ncbi:MAG: hypothetical protein AB7J46_06715 [Candidatus Altimarinota bacterium]
MSTLTTERWNELSDKARWDIFAAMRGPDSFYGETLKWFTTAVIRGRVRRVYRVGGTVNQKLKLVVLPDQRGCGISSYSASGKTAWNASHFVEHIEQAAAWLGVPVLWIPEQLWHEVMNGGGRKTAAEKILKYFDENPKDYHPSKELEILRKHLECLKSGIF